MNKVYPAPTVYGVVNGELDLIKTPQPAVTLTYHPIHEPHTISVLWEILDIVPAWLYCCELCVSSGGVYSTPIKPREAYADDKAVGKTVRVRYSVSINGAPPVFSAPLKFKCKKKNAIPQPSGHQLDLAIRETADQYLGLDPTIYRVEVRTDAIGESAHAYAIWPSMATKRMRLALLKDGKPVWHSDYQSSTEVPATFEIPKSKLLQYDKGSLEANLSYERDETLTPWRPLTLCINKSCAPD